RGPRGPLVDPAPRLATKRGGLLVELHRERRTKAARALQCRRQRSQAGSRDAIAKRGDGLALRHAAVDLRNREGELGGERSSGGARDLAEDGRRAASCGGSHGKQVEGVGESGEQPGAA